AAEHAGVSHLKGTGAWGPGDRLGSPAGGPEAARGAEDDCVGHGSRAKRLGSFSAGGGSCGAVATPEHRADSRDWGARRTSFLLNGAEPAIPNCWQISQRDALLPIPYPTGTQ